MVRWSAAYADYWGIHLHAVHSFRMAVPPLVLCCLFPVSAYAGHWTDWSDSLMFVNICTALVYIICIVIIVSLCAALGNAICFIGQKILRRIYGND